ncbi:MAG: IS200/IS605 family transposase [Flavobacteriaceae bacterium]
MANTYTQIYVQVVIVVKNRQCLIKNTWKTELYKYITGIIKNNGHKVMQINGVTDHIHILIGLKPSQSLSELMKYVKQDSSKWVNQNNFLKVKFSWQSGYGAFSYATSQVPNVISYIQNQEEHHKKKSFSEEYLDFLNDYKISFDKQYLFRSVK